MGFCPEKLPASILSSFPVPSYPVNANGKTYGTLAFTRYIGAEPDLVACLGIDGTYGYCYQTDLDGEQVNNPEEAIEYMQRLEEMRRNGEQYERIIPLYAEDGITVIGEFGMGDLGANVHVGENTTDYAIAEPVEPADSTIKVQPATPRTGGGYLVFYYGEHQIVDATLMVGESVSFGWKFSAGAELNGDPTILWESSDTSVFTVDSVTGEINAIGHGTAVCTATAEYRTVDDTVGYITGECIIRVK